MVEVVIPSAEIDVGLAEIVEVAADTGPGVNATHPSVPIEFPLIVPPTSAVPVVVELVSVAVYVPSPLSVTPEIVPSVVLNRTVAPPDVSSMPLESSAWTVIVVVEIPSAVIDVELAEIVEPVSHGVVEEKLTHAAAPVVLVPTSPSLSEPST